MLHPIYRLWPSGWLTRDRGFDPAAKPPAASVIFITLVSRLCFLAFRVVFQALEGSRACGPHGFAGFRKGGRQPGAIWPGWAGRAMRIARKEIHGFSNHRRGRLPRTDGPERRAVAVRRLRSPAAQRQGLRPPSRQVLPDRARQPGAAPAAAPHRPCRIARRAAAARAARGADPGARRRTTRTGPRSAAPVADLLDTIDLQHPSPKPAACAGPRAGSRRDRSRDPQPAARICWPRSSATASSRPMPPST